MTGIRQTKSPPPEAKKPGAETLHLRKSLQTKEMAWLRVLKEAQARQQCRQL